MSGKAVITTLTILSLALGACTKVHESSAPSQSSSAPAAKITPAKNPVTKPAPRPTTTRPSQRTNTKSAPSRPMAPAVKKVTPSSNTPYDDLLPLLEGNASWNTYGHDLTVTNGANPPVPIFRQAIVLAAVRATLADSPVEPTAEFLKGTLTLKFNHGTSREIAADINRTLKVPEVSTLCILLGS